MGFYEKEYWLGDGWGRSRFERMSGAYYPFVPDLLSDNALLLTPEAARAAATAQARIVALDSSAVHFSQAEPLARLLLRSEAVASSKIEGLTMSAGKLLEYEALDELGVSHRLDSVEAAVLANIDAMQRGIVRADSGEMLTLDDICDINKALLAQGDLAEFGGALRDRQNWIGGNSSNPLAAAYVPPKPEYVPALMDDLIHFINESRLPSVAVAAIAHAQLETIHPFADGNGRTGRTLQHIILRRAGLAQRVVPPVSLVLATDKDRYIAHLTSYRFDEDDATASWVQCTNDWIEYFSHAMIEAVDRAGMFEELMLDVERSWRNKIAARSGSVMDVLLGKLIDNPVISIESARRLTGKTYESARAVVSQLVSAGILTQNARNRKSNLYVAKDVIAAFTRYERSLSVPGGDTAQEKPLRPVPAKIDVEDSRRALKRSRKLRG